MKSSTKLLGLALPLATILVLAVLLTGSGVPQIGPMPDMIVTVLELAVRTLYAIAIGGSAAVSMQVTGMNVANARRCELLDEAAGGELGPMVVLLGETLAWFGWVTVWCFVYLP